MTTKHVTMADAGIGFVKVATWSAMAGADDGDPIYVGNFKLVSAQAIGNGTSVSIQGSNDGVNFAALATAVTLTIAAGVTPVTRILEFPLYIKPVTTGGTSTVVVVAGMMDQ